MRLCCQGHLRVAPKDLARFPMDPDNLERLMAGWPSFRLRGPTYFLLFLAVPNLALCGAWFAALLALLAVAVLASGAQDLRSAIRMRPARSANR